MQIVLNDTCCLIDLRKVGLLRKMLDLPYRIAVIYPLRASELPGIPEGEWAVLEAAGLEVIDVPSVLVQEAESAKRRARGPSFHDCLSLVQAQALGRECVLLTNDLGLRKLAVQRRMTVHGTLWLMDELLQHGVLNEQEYIAVLDTWNADPWVFLPKDEMQRRLQLAG